MLPAGATADSAPYPAQQTLKAMFPRARTVALVLVGGCSCDLVRARLPQAKDDERHLRGRYRSQGLSRDAMIAALERHRRGPRAQRPDGWRQALAAFVSEHARNAGPTLYLLRFEPGESSGTPASLSAPVRNSPTMVRLHPDAWLAEGIPTLIG